MKKSETKVEQGDFVFRNTWVQPKLIPHPLFLKCFMACEVFPVLVLCPACFGGQTRAVGFSGRGGPIAQGAAVPCHQAQGEAKAVPACCLRSALPPSQVDPYLPYEYTCEGMLERIHAYIQYQVGEHPCSSGRPSLFLRDHPCSPMAPSLFPWTRNR